MGDKFNPLLTAMQDQGDKAYGDEVLEELTLSVRKVSIQSDEMMEDAKSEQRFNTPSKFRAYSVNFNSLNPINFVEDAGTEASMDGKNFQFAMIETPKFDKDC